MKPLIPSLLALAACLVFAFAQDKPVSAHFTIDAAFPGGNILVTRIEGDTIQLGPDQRDSMLPWFYWYFRVTGASGKKFTTLSGADLGALDRAIAEAAKR